MKMACIGCRFWEHDGAGSRCDLLYGTCSKTGERTPHTGTCDEEESSEVKGNRDSNK